MEPFHVYAALLDILAYRQHLEADRKSGSLHFHKRLSAALKAFDSVNDTLFRVQAISDTIIMTCVGHEHFPQFLGILRDVFVAFLAEGLFVRGGVAYSRHFQSNRLTYSHALAKAHELESRLAIYPRIVLDENIIAMYEVGQHLPSIRSSGFLCLENGVFFLDVLTNENWDQVYTYATQIYESNVNTLKNDQEAFAKHLRFQHYLLESSHAPSGASAYIAGIAGA